MKETESAFYSVGVPLDKTNVDKSRTDHLEYQENNFQIWRIINIHTKNSIKELSKLLRETPHGIPFLIQSIGENRYKILKIVEQEDIN